MTTRNHDRKIENTNISISLPRSILIELDHIAEGERRSRSNLITILLDRELKQVRRQCNA